MTIDTASGGATPGSARSGWKIHRPGSYPGFDLLIALLCFGNSVNKKYENFTISDRRPLTTLFDLF